MKRLLSIAARCVIALNLVRLVPSGVSTGLLLGAGGCATVPVNQQRLVAKPNMVFSESPVFNYYSRILPQVESGASSSGGAQAAGCTSCR